MADINQNADANEMYLATELLEAFGTREAAETWLQMPNPVLVGATPGSYLQRGDETAIRHLLRMASSGMPT